MANSLREKIIDGFLDFLPPNCKDASKLVSESMDHHVPIVKRLKIKYHLSLCEACRNYKKQLETIRNLAESLKKEDLEIANDSQLKSSTKEKMKKLLEDK